MKIRYGFIPNSSSSSFIIFLDKTFAITKENIKKFVFDNLDEVCYCFSDISKPIHRLLKTDELVEYIYNEFTYAQKRKQVEPDYSVIKEIAEEFSGQIFNELYERADLWKNADADRHEKIDEISEISEKESLIKATELIAANEDKIPIVVSFSDQDSGFGSHLEHSGIIVEKFNAIRFSHH